MKLDVFPEVYEAKRRSEMQQNIWVSESEYHRKEQEYKSYQAAKQKEDPVETFLMCGVAIFIVCSIVGFFNCSCTLLDESVDSLDTFVRWLIIGIVLAVITVFIMILSDNIGDSSKEKNVEAARLAYESTRQYEEERAVRDVMAYTRKFNTAVDERCSYFATREDTDVVAKLAATELLRRIHGSDRSKRIPKVMVTFPIRVYCERIEWPGDMILMKARDLRPLEGPVDQAALAFAIGAAVRQKICQELPRDPGGTKFQLELSRSNADNSATVTITYQAVNSGYVALRDW